jgi:uncharacterized protein
VRVLLPPSEGKASGGRGRPLDSRPDAGPLHADRQRVLAALEELVAGDPATAAAALLLPPGVAADALAANRRVRKSPTMPALRRYRGVVYDGLDYERLTAEQQRLAARSVLIFSGLFGVVRGDEAVPEYRVPAKAVLPGIGVAGTFWRPRLDQALPPVVGRHLIIDLRSSDYSPMWRPPAPRSVAVRVLSPLPSGALGVVSYPSKFAKGQLVAGLITRIAGGHRVDSADDVAATWLASGGRAAEVISPSLVQLHT